MCSKVTLQLAFATTGWTSRCARLGITRATSISASLGDSETSFYVRRNTVPVDAHRSRKLEDMGGEAEAGIVRYHPGGGMSKGSTLSQSPRMATEYSHSALILSRLLFMGRNWSMLTLGHHTLVAQVR